MTDGPGDPIDQDDKLEVPAPLQTRVLQAAIAVAVLLVLGLAFLHVATPPVPAGNTPPDGHLPGPCWVCHLVSRSTGGTDEP